MMKPNQFFTNHTQPSSVQNTLRSSQTKLYQETEKISRPSNFMPSQNVGVYKESHHLFNATQKLSNDKQLHISDVKGSITPQGANRQQTNILDQPSSTSGNRPTRMSSAQPANRQISYNSNSNDFITSANQESAQWSLQDQQQQVLRQSRPSTGKRHQEPQNPTRESQTSSLHTLQQYQLSQQESQRQAKEQSQRRQQPPVVDNNIDSKFSSLVCQVPQGVDPKQMALKQNQNKQKQESSSTTLESSSQHQTEDGQQDIEYLLGPQRRKDMGKKTLVLDLDETLVHSSFKPVEGADIVLPVEIEGSICNIFIQVRPGVDQFLKRMHKHYELVVFTASLSKYAEPLVKILDPEGMCSYKLFREHCTFVNNAFVKDLLRLGRPMKDLLILDNSPIAYMFQPENAMPILSWYDSLEDRELPRLGLLLERLAYEDDVRKIIRKLIVNNDVDPRAEQLYLQSQKRDHSQRVSERSSQQQQNKKGRYESADNRNKHSAIVDQQIKKRHGVDDQHSKDHQVELMNQNKLAMRNNFILRQSQDSLVDLQKQQHQQVKDQQLNIQIINNSAQNQRGVSKDRNDKSPIRGSNAHDHPSTTKGHSSNKNPFFNSNQYKSTASEAPSNQNTTPISKRSSSVRQSQQHSTRDHQRKERGHSASATNNHKTHSTTSSSRRKNTYTNFLSNTQKLSREDQIIVDKYGNSTRGSSQMTGHATNINVQQVSSRPSTAGHTSQHKASQSQSVRNSHSNFSATQRLTSSNLQNYQPVSHNSQSAHQPHHQKKNSTSNASSILKQSLRDFQDMLKLTQTKINKHTSSSNHSKKQHHQQQPSFTDDGSFLKKLSRHSEIQQNIQPSQLQQTQQQQYASRYTVNSPKYKENLNILNGNPSQQTNSVLTSTQGPLQASLGNIIMQPNHHIQVSKHQKRVSNPFQVVTMRTNNHVPQDNSSIDPEERNHLGAQNQKAQQIKLVHNVNNSNQYRQPQGVKQSRESQGKYINSYLSSVNATPTAAAQSLRQSLCKGIPKDDPLLKEFNKNFYSQVGYNTQK